MEPSPYLPTSRRFINPLYLRVEAIDEFAYVRQRGSIRKSRAEVQALTKKSNRIDRDAVWRAKRAALVHSRATRMIMMLSKPGPANFDRTNSKTMRGIV